MENNLFHTDQTALKPLPERLRPRSLEDVLGQEHILGDGQPLRRMLDEGRLSSVIFWGPPGCGKTTISRLLAEAVDARFVAISAIFSGVADLKKIFQEAKGHFEQGVQTILFVDEIHRFNKAQQDSFLPFVESGVIILVGATTENPSFELNNALLSRCQVFTLHPLTENALEMLMKKAEESLKIELPLDEHGRQTLINMSEGDGRYLLMLIDNLPTDRGVLSANDIKALISQRAAHYDKNGDQHYNLMSAFHKSLRGSDVQAELYWLAQMLSGGEDPRYIARRLIRFASEDVGLADPQGLQQALAAAKAFERLGSPEGELALAQATAYLATAPKSNALYKAFKAAAVVAHKTSHKAPPQHILNAPTQLMKEQGYGSGYAYDHDAEDGFSGQNYFPEGVPREDFYHPVERGFEREIRKRLDYWQGLRERKKS